MSWTRQDTAPHRKHDIILVDARDRPVGTGLKEPVHRQGLLHRAFSVFLVDRGGRWLLQQRAAGKYHSPLLWANACCGHPLPGETVREAGARRLREELGVEAPLEHLGHLVYKSALENGRWEHEFDHVLLGVYGGPFAPDPAEVAALRWVAPASLHEELADRPERFAVWFRTIVAGQATGAGMSRLLG